MALNPGVRLGPYEIVSAIGAGGMGEVYRARDTRLDRAVAIKVLPSQLATDPELRARFDREARAVSSLNHPHICALYDVGCESGTDFLVLELLEGETLAERIARTGALPPTDALKFAIEICSALDRAHRAGIVHRDLKPANVMLTKAGAKLLDFGLAKSAAPVVAVTGLSMMPTTPHGVTAQGTILGTFQYMAPEQIEGLDADTRTDLFAFGALLFEMLTGRAAFEGKTRASLLGAILKDEPPRVSTLQPVAPHALDRVVSTCLAKDRDDRYQTARDLLRDLRWVASGDAATALPPVAVVDPPRTRAAWTIAVLSLAIAAAAVLLGPFGRTAPPIDPIQFTIPPPADATFAAPTGGGTGVATQIAISPDGRLLAFVARRRTTFQLWLRPIGSIDARALPGTEDSAFPFWSPDSRYIAFFAGGKLKKVAVAGGPPVVLCDAPGGRGGAWNRDNVILFTPSSTEPLQRVSGAGGIPQPASALDVTYGESSHRFPSFLPDGRHFVFSAVVGTCCPAAKTGRIRVGGLDSADAATLIDGDSVAMYSAAHLLFDREGTLMAVPFDAAARRLTGDPFPVAEQIAFEGSRFASFSASDTGTLVYARAVARPVSQLTWLDRTGRTVGTVGPPSAYLGISLSPDERRVATSTANAAADSRDIWILDVASGTPSRFTFDAGASNAPIWAPDGRRIVFSANREGRPTLRLKRTDGSTTEESMPTPDDRSGAALAPSDWSADGRYVIYSRAQGVKGSTDVWALRVGADAKAFPVAQTAATENLGALSPNGRWIAYQATETAQPHIYVQPFPPTGGKFQVSTSGAYHPTWRPDGKELFFLSQDGQMMAAPVETTGEFQAGAPVALFALPSLAPLGAGSRQYAVTKDGRFLVNVFQQPSTTTPLTVLVNWRAAVQK